MNFQEISVILIVLIAAFFSIRTFVKQFSSQNPSCSSCSCDSPTKKSVERHRNAIRYKKIKSF